MEQNKNETLCKTKVISRNESRMLKNNRLETREEKYYYETWLIG